MTKKTLFSTDNTALITGAALGIGRSAAAYCAGQGMHVCLVDILGDDLEKAAREAREAANQAGHTENKILPVPLDIADQSAWQALHQQLEQEFGTLNLLMNNAVTRIGRGFDASRDQWRQAFETNFWSIVTAVDLFLPQLRKANGKSAIVNVGSKQGITNPPGHPIYNIAKSAIKTYSEQLEHALRTEEEGTATQSVTTHLLVPGWTTTGRAEHKPGAWLPAQVVERMVQAVDNGDFYIICPDGEVSESMDKKRIQWGAGDITDNRPPLSRWHQDFKSVASVTCDRD